MGLLALGTVWALFPMSVEALTARSQGRRAAKAKMQDLAEAQPVRSLVAGRLPRARQAFNFRHHLCPIPLAIPPPPAQHFPRHTVLGHRRPARRLRDQQRPLRRPLR